ncbi:MAG TPA: ATP-binding protein [Actinomycetota bacterium]|jgi:signal transduction histidine kinase|nr:ATP-binding protein [Actinomycetota bacterium]
MAAVTLLVCRRSGSLGEAEPAFAEHTLESAGDGYRAVELAHRLSPAAVVVELAAAALAPLDLVRRLREAAPAIKIVFVLETEAVEAAAEVLRAGADGVLAPDPTAADLRWGVGSALAGGSPISPPIAKGLAQRFADVVHREQQWSRSLAEISRQAEALATTKAEFLSNVSHELRTPLTIIKGVAQVVGRFGGASEEQAGMLAQLQDAATKLTRMVENLLVLAEMERGEFRLEIEDCDLAELVRAGTDDAAARYPHVALDVRVPHTIQARADAERMREVIRHLVDNACRYSDEGDTVTVQAKKADEGVTVSVTDQGSGVDRKVVSAAFGEAFSPGEAVLTKERAGLGLGLNLARTIIAMHGGILSADPLPGGGSRLAFVLPSEPAEQPAPPASAEAAPGDDPLAMLRELQQRLSDSESRAQ